MQNLPVVYDVCHPHLLMKIAISSTVQQSIAKVAAYPNAKRNSRWGGMQFR